MDGVEDPVNLLPEKGLGRRESSHLPSPPPPGSPGKGAHLPGAEGRLGETVSQRAWLCPVKLSGAVGKRRALHSDHVLAQQTCHFQGGNLCLRIFLQ